MFSVTRFFSIFLLLLGLNIYVHSTEDFFNLRFVISRFHWIYLIYSQVSNNRQLRDFNFTFIKFLFSAKLSGLAITLEQTRFTT